MFKPIVCAAWLLAATVTTSLQAQEIDREWMQAKAAQMSEALKRQDRTALDALLQESLEASAGTGQEIFGLLTHVNVLLQLGEYDDVGPMAERILAREPSLLAGSWGQSLSYLQQTAEAVRESDVVGAISLQRARAAILAAFQPDEAWMQHSVHNTSFVWAAIAQNYVKAGDALERMHRVGAPLSDELKQQLFSMSETFLPLAQFSGSRGESTETQMGLAKIADFASKLGEAGPLLRARSIRAMSGALETAGRLKDSEARLQEALVLLPADDVAAEMLRERALILEDIGRLALLREDWPAAQAAFVAADSFAGQAEEAGDASLGATDRAAQTILRGDLQTGLERYQDALDLYGKATVILKKRMQDPDVKANEYADLAQAHIKIALTHLNLDNRQAALASAREALGVLRQNGSGDEISLPINLYNVADTFAAAGELSEGLALMSEAQEQARAVLPATSLMRADIAANRATLLDRLGKADEARESVAEAEAIYRNPVNRGRLKEGRLPFAIAAWNAVEDGDNASAFEQLQWTQITDAADAVEATARRAGVDDPVLAAALRERQDLTTQIDRTQAQLRQATLSSAGAGSSASANLLRDTLADSSARLAEMDRRLAGRDYDILGVGGFSPMSLQRAQSLLRDDEALVTFLLPGLKADLLGRTEASSNYVIVVTKSDMSVRPIAEASRRQLIERAGRLRCAMAIGCDAAKPAPSNDVVSNTRGNLLASEPETDGSEANAKDEITEDAYSLYSSLLGPADELIADVKHLIIAPPSDLLGLPFAALVTQPVDGNGNPDWLIRRQAISVLPSVGALDSLRRRDAATSSGKPRLFAVGDPMIGGRRDTAANCNLQVADLRSAPSGDQPSLLDTASIDLATGFALADPSAVSALPALPDAECELRALQAAFSKGGDAETDVLLRENATEGTVRRLSQDGALATYDTLIFATHGLVRGEVGATEPALVLTPPASPTGKDDGLLTAGEVASLRLDADLVVLSACNTAAGADTNADGMSGLARAFFHAGARALMVTHWSVYSSAATEMSSRMFQRRAARPGLRHAEALRLAMIDVMDDPRGGLRREPSYWAAFTIVGL